MTPTHGVHSLDHSAHHVEIVVVEVGPALAQDVQHVLPSRGARLVGEGFGVRTC